ncbi:MAG: NAD(P)/FAD-dependent oxidoreductase [Anaerolineae bacterium]
MTGRIIVVGGGPAGLMAAGQAAALGADVLLVERMERPGLKLRITGKGRGNLTNTAPLGEFLGHFGPGGRWLRPVFRQFFNRDLLAFFAEIGVETVTERGGRVFPASQAAEDVVTRMTAWAQGLGVRFAYERRVQRLLIEDDRVTGVAARYEPVRRGRKRRDPLPAEAGRIERLQADAVIIATGGKSYPATGSTGDGYELARQVGHTITPVRPALVPLVTAGSTAAQLQGVSLRNVRASVWADGRKQADAFGEMLLTHFGLSGPIILTLSREVVDLLAARRQVEISIDLKPVLDDRKLDQRLVRDLNASGKQQFQTMLKGLLPRKLIPVCLDLVGIPAEKLNHQITAEERKRLRRWLKDFRLEVTGHRGYKEAIVTAGGVSLPEVDAGTMASRLVSGLYFAGEVLDIDADTGGYNLQAAFSTGWVAGRAAAQGYNPGA